MKTHDLTRFATLLATICSVYHKTLSETLTEIYWQALKDYPLDQIQQALTQHISDPDTGQYFPKPADVIRRITGSAHEEAQAAWVNVEYAIRRFGTYESVAFDDALIHSVIKTLGGWSRLCEDNHKTLTQTAKQFHQQYKQLFSNPPDTYPAALSGRLGNRQPKLIGEREKAHAVFAAGEDVPPRKLALSECTEE
jgi:hypothetical protein